MAFLALILFALVVLLAALLRLRPKELKSPPNAPCWQPFLQHSLLFLGNPSKLASVITAPSREPLLRFRTPRADLWLVKGPQNVWSVLSNPQKFDFVGLNTMFLKNVLDMPQRVVHMVRKDNSGINPKPLPGTNMPLSQRFQYMKHKATHNVIGRTGLATLNARFEANLSQWIEGSDIGEDWVQYPDMYLFLRDILFKTSVDAFFGPLLLEKSPQLAQDLWQFDEDLPILAKGLPRFFNPKARVARDRCIQAIREWRENAIQVSKDTRCREDENWSQHWGLKCMELRNEVFQRFEEWDADACAATDTAILWAMNTNIVPASFWFFFEIIRDKDLFAEVRDEVKRSCVSVKSGDIDLKTLLSQPLLSSIYTEILRQYVAIIMIRESQEEHVLGSWTIPKHENVVVCSYTEHMNPALWNTGAPQDPHGIETFWAKRFLDSKASHCTFTMEGPNGRWLPFGLGERMCPGRHFAKTQMLLTMAKLTLMFDFELETADMWRPKVDMNHFGFGTLPPGENVPFRWRRRPVPMKGVSNPL